MNRRLRQQRKAPLYIAQRELQRSPWKVFFAGIILCAFIGGLMRLSLSEAVFTQYVQYVLKTNNPNWKFKAQGAKLSFSKWGIPRVAIVLEYLELYDLSTKCTLEPKAVFSELEIPVRFWKWVVHRKLEISTLHSQSVSWNESGLCQTALAKGFLNQLSYAPLDIWSERSQRVPSAPIRPNLSDRLFSLAQLSKYQNLIQSLFHTLGAIKKESISWPKIEIGDLYVNTAVPFEVKDVVVNFQEAQWSAGGQFVAFLPSYSRRSYQIPFQLHMDEHHLNFEAGRSLGEGRWRISLNGEYYKRSNDRVHFGIETHSLPLSLAGALLKKWNQFPLLESLRYVWSNCSMDFSLPLAGEPQLKISQPGCRFEGKYGPVDLAIDNSAAERPSLELKVAGASMKEWRPYCRSGLECEMAEWGGVFQGRLRLIPRQGWAVDGQLIHSHFSPHALRFRNIMTTGFSTKLSFYGLLCESNEEGETQNPSSPSHQVCVIERMDESERMASSKKNQPDAKGLNLALLSATPVGQRIYVQDQKGSRDFLTVLKEQTDPKVSAPIGSGH